MKRKLLIAQMVRKLLQRERFPGDDMLVIILKHRSVEIENHRFNHVHPPWKTIWENSAHRSLEAVGS